MSDDKSRKIPYLDGWRGMAIVLVLIGHFGPWRFNFLGKFGVVLFFVLSGLFMGRILFINKIDLKSFFVRRFSRVVPTFWLYVTAATAYAAYFQPHPFNVRPDVLLSTYFFLSAYFPRDVSIFAEQWPNGHTWSLNVEEHCYFYLAAVSVFVAFMKDKISKEFFLCTSAVLTACVTVLYIQGMPSFGSTPWGAHTEVAALGLITSAALVVLFNQKDYGWVTRSPWPPVIAFAVAFTASFENIPFAAPAHYLVAPIFAAIAVNLAHNFHPVIKTALSTSGLRWFGKCSFSIYLWQQPFYMLVRDSHMQAYLMLPAAIAVGTISFYCFEDPIRIYLNRKWSERKERRLYFRK